VPTRSGTWRKPGGTSTVRSKGFAMARTDAELLEECCQIELTDRTPEELDGAYQAICVLVMAKTSLALRGPKDVDMIVKKQAWLDQRSAAQWVDGNVGEWTFTSVCDALDMDVRFARERLIAYAESARRRTINTSAPRKVFGRVYSHADAVAETEAPD
jgi:hypothetical protein